MTSQASQWADHFLLTASDAELDEKIRIPLVAPTGLSKLSASEARSLLDRTLKTVVVPNSQMRSTLRQLASVARSFAADRYPDERAYIRLAYSPTTVDFMPPVICLTGLAGVGKSAISKAFQRLFPPGNPIEVPGHAAFPLIGFWQFSFAGFSGLSKLLTQNFRDPRIQKSKGAASKAVAEAVAQGISLISTDELQFLTQSSANTLAAKVLLQMSAIGPPLVFTSNYSMLHRLMNRPHEERQRLLTFPIIIHPLAPDSDDWKKLVRELLRTASELSGLRGVLDIEEQLHTYTFGIPRSLVLLLGIAYSLARRRSDTGNVGLNDIESAYRSVDYSSTRDDIVALVEGLLNPRKLRSDLACPLNSVDPKPASSDKVSSHPSIGQHMRRSREAALISSLNKNERAAYEAVSGRESNPKPPRTRNQPRPPASIESLIEGADKFAKSKTKPIR